LTNNFARRFVMGGSVITRMSHRYVEVNAPRRETPLSRNSALHRGDFTMRKAILTILGSTLLAASTVQIAAAAEHHKARQVYRAPAPMTEEFRNSNAYWPAPYSYAEPYYWSRYQNGAESAPAGR
jgi:hypothetical protein